MQEPSSTPECPTETAQPSGYQKPTLTSHGPWQVITGSVGGFDFEG